MNYENDPYNDDTQKRIGFGGFVIFCAVVVLGIIKFVLQFIE